MIDLTKLFNFDPHEEISQAGYFWTPLHYAAHFNSSECLKFLIKVAYVKYPGQFVEIMNINSKEKYTPLMTACIYNSKECVRVLLECGGIFL